MIVEVTTHGSVIKRDHDSFVIKNDDSSSEIPAEKIEAIIITSNSLISTQAIRLCIEKEIQLVVSDWSGRPIARLWSSTPGKATQIRRRQYLTQETRLSFEISRHIVSVKLQRQRKFLRYLINNRDSVPEQLERAISVITKSISSVSSLGYSSDAKNMLLGYEGSSAMQYFDAISKSLPIKWQFEGRSQNPARDPFNATLNYLYGITYGSVEKIIILSGLDPNAGFYHSDIYGKPTLSFDIIELVRPVIDRTVVSIFTKRMAKESWFEDRSESGISMSKDARMFLISEYREKNLKDVEATSWKFCGWLIEKIMEGNK
ncbi:MAG: CRISPR-associated endonuclease Cas1 [Thaumarchaeota archaeon]|nr:CRISPR-associated endonuclease Cas1 [Nitrososphaerota archaeon]